MGRRHLDGEVSDRGPVEVGRRSFSLSLKAQVALWVLGGFGRLLALIFTRPVGLLLVITGGLALYDGLALASIAVGLLLTLLGVWAWLDRESYDRRVPQRLRGWWRGRTTYRPQWESVLGSSKVKLTEKSSSRAGVLLPHLRFIRSTKGRDLLRVRMLPGQILADWVEVAHRLAVGFNCPEDAARVGSTAPWRPSWLPKWVPVPNPRQADIQLSFLHVDPLAEPVVAHPPAEVPDFKALPVALAEDGTWYRLRLFGQHLFIVGASGAGKGSVLWSIITQLSGAVRTGLVELVGLDPKGGVELGMGAQVFKTLCRGSEIGADGKPVVSLEAAMADVLEHYVGVMRQRQDRMFGRWRTHKPSIDAPYVVIVIDEISALVAKAYQTDKSEGERFVAALNLLLSQGRAMGITIIGAGQDARKEIVPMRGLFTDRIALRLNEEGDVDLGLGSGSRARGAWCDKIRRDRQGTAYAVSDDWPDPIRMRFPYATDPEIARLPGAPGRLRTAPPALADSTPEAAAAPAPSWLPDEFKDGDAA